MKIENEGKEVLSNFQKAVLSKVYIQQKGEVLLVRNRQADVVVSAMYIHHSALGDMTGAGKRTKQGSIIH